MRRARHCWESTGAWGSEAEVPSAPHSLHPKPSQPCFDPALKGRGGAQQLIVLPPGPPEPCSSSEPSLSAAGGGQAALPGKFCPVQTQTHINSWFAAPLNPWQDPDPALSASAAHLVAGRGAAGSQLREQE